MKTNLLRFADNVYSQWGEDGVIEKIFYTIKPQSKICIEFGAWDGFHFANTANLWSNNGWKGILIEGHQERFLTLQNNTNKYDCICINAYVAKGGDWSLENILKNNKIDYAVDLLSIDIDGNDYYIFDSLDSLRPRVVVCEYNPTIPAHLDVYQEYGDSNFGCSVTALIRIADQKGYALIAITDTNCFFVLEKYKELFSSYETQPENIKIDKYLTFLMTSYSGNYVVSSDALPYGCNYPYDGVLNGKVERMQFKMPGLRIFDSVSRKIRYFVKAINFWRGS
jgi:hypothetical protein